MNVVETIREYVGTRLWVPPSIGVALGLLLAGAGIALDSHWVSSDFAFPLAFSGSVRTAQTVLTAIAGATATFLALIFTILIIAVQIAVTQYSPRGLRSLMQDAPAHFAIGAFIGTFTYCIVVLQSLRAEGPGGQAFVGALSVPLAFGLALLCLVSFAVYSSHLTHSVRTTSFIDRVADRTRSLIERRFSSLEDSRPDDATVEAEPAHPDRAPSRTITAEAPGILVDVRVARLVEVASDGDFLVEVVPLVGDFVPTGADLLRVYGEPADGDEDGGLRSGLEIAGERTLARDVAFGFRLLVDVAERSLSPALNDPTTAVQAIDGLHDFLRRIGTSRFPPTVHRDDSGNARVVLRERRWEDYVDLATDELRHYGRGSIQVARRLRAMLLDLAGTVDEERLAPLERQLRLLDAMVERDFPDREDRERARQPDPQGHGGRAPAGQERPIITQ